MKNLSFLCILILNSCAQIPDEWVCRRRSATTGFCTKTISNIDTIVDDTHTINGKTWIDLEIESVYVPAESWAKLKEYIIKQCKNTSKCGNNVDSWTRKIDSVSP